MTRRRDLLIAVAALGGAASVGPLWRRVRPFDFREITGQPGYRELDRTAIGGLTGLTLVGLSPSPQPELQDAIAAVRADLDRALGHHDAANLPLTVFTDYNCPSCRKLEAWLLPWSHRTPSIDLRLLDLPLLGPASERAARASIAATQLGAGMEAHQWLATRSLRPGAVALATLATEIGLDPGQFVKTHDSEATRRILRGNRALAAVLGVVGTPTLMVGRTKIIGALGKSELKRLIRLERARFFG